MKTLFVANDGKIFENEKECREYEALPKKVEYEVEFECRGYAYVRVKAFSEEEAKILARDYFDEDDISWDEVSCSIVES